MVKQVMSNKLHIVKILNQLCLIDIVNNTYFIMKQIAKRVLFSILKSTSITLHYCCSPVNFRNIRSISLYQLNSSGCSFNQYFLRTPDIFYHLLESSDATMHLIKPLYGEALEIFKKYIINILRQSNLIDIDRKNFIR